MFACALCGGDQPFAFPPAATQALLERFFSHVPGPEAFLLAPEGMVIITIGIMIMMKIMVVMVISWYY